MIEMTKNEYLAELLNGLKNNDIADAADIVGEYEQHFAFKMADGFSEEEISAKLGDPAALAAQFERSADAGNFYGKKFMTVFGLVFSDIFAAVIFILLFAWEAIMAAFALASATVAVCLFGGLNIYMLIPSIPYWCGAVFGLSFASLAVLTAIGCVYFAVFVRQLTRSYGRFRHNAISSAYGRAVLPSLAVYPKLPAKINRRIRLAALIALTVFAVSFVLGIIISMLSSGALGFWHAWGWFGYTK